MIALTYTTGRARYDTAEAGDPPRVAGQFPRYRSAALREPDQAVAIDAPVTATRGGVVLYVAPDHDFDAAGQPAEGVLLSWRADDDNRIEAYFDKTAGDLTLVRLDGGAGAPVSVAWPFAAGVGAAVYLAWDADALYVAVQGGAIATVANSAIPASLPAAIDIGSRDGDDHFEATFGGAAFLSDPVAVGRWIKLAGLATERPPAFGEVVGERMAALWIGELPIYWRAEDSIDLTRDGFHFRRLIGAGISEVDHRIVQTPLGDGGVYIDSRLRSRTLTTLVTFVGSSWADIQAVRGELAARANPMRGVGVLSYAWADRVYEIGALLDGGAGIDQEPFFVGDVPIDWICPRPGWRTVPTFARGVITSGGWSIPWSIPWAFSAPGLVLEVENGGHLEAFPIFTVTAGESGLSGPSFTRVESGETFTLSGLTLAAGEQVIVDMEERTATKGDGTDVIGFSGGEMWALARGDNEVRVRVEAGGGSAAIEFAPRLVGV